MLSDLFDRTKGDDRDGRLFYARDPKIRADFVSFGSAESFLLLECPLYASLRRFSVQKEHGRRFLVVWVIVDRADYYS